MSIIDQSNINKPLCRDVTEAWRRAQEGVASPEGGTDWDVHLEAVRLESGFHWRNGIFFRRLENGDVRITEFYSWNYCPNYRVFDIPKNEWASIISTVSREGETSDSYRLARSFHDSSLNLTADNAS